jgi:hypothetical protein
MEENSGKLKVCSFFMVHNKRPNVFINHQPRAIGAKISDCLPRQIPYGCSMGTTGGLLAGLSLLPTPPRLRRSSSDSTLADLRAQQEFFESNSSPPSLFKNKVQVRVSPSQHKIRSHVAQDTENPYLNLSSFGRSLNEMGDDLSEVSLLSLFCTLVSL